MLTEHGAQRRLSQHVGGGQVLLDLNDRLFRVDDPEIEHRIDLHRHVVMRDHVLRRNLDHLDSKVHANHFLNERDQDHEAGPLHPVETTEGEDDGALVLAQDLHGRERPDQESDCNDRQTVGNEERHGANAFASRSRPVSSRWGSPDKSGGEAKSTRLRRLAGSPGIYSN